MGWDGMGYRGGQIKLHLQLWDFLLVPTKLLVEDASLLPVSTDVG